VTRKVRWIGISRCTWFTARAAQAGAGPRALTAPEALRTAEEASGSIKSASSAYFVTQLCYGMVVVVAGRPAIFKRGAMTAAERMRRYRRKQRKEKREAEREEMRRRNRERYAAYHTPEKDAARDAEIKRQMALRREALNMIGQLPEVKNAGPADELVRQLAEAMMIEKITVDDFRRAFNRRFGPP
jgi:hypothetical protein